MRALHETMRKNFKGLDAAAIQKTWCCYESPSLFFERWEKIFGEFADDDRTEFDPSKVSELYDSLKHDALHNRPFLESIFVDREVGSGMGPIKDLYTKAKIIFDFVAPLECGINEWLGIGIVLSLDPHIGEGKERAGALKVKEVRGKQNRDREECTDAWGNKKEEKMANVSFMYILTWCQSIKHSFVLFLGYISSVR